MRLLVLFEMASRFVLGDPNVVNSGRFKTIHVLYIYLKKLFL
jgi:hypothetical protein